MTRLTSATALCAAAAAWASAGCNSPPATMNQVQFETQPPSGMVGARLVFSASVRGKGTDTVRPITVSLGTNPSHAELRGTLTRSPVNGVVTFDDLVVTKPGQYTLVASAATALAATSATFSVAYSSDEQEAPGASTNDTPAQAEPITPNMPLFGALSSPDDVDWYRFHARAGQLLAVSSYATRLDADAWDTSLRIRLVTSDGTELQRIGVAETGFASVDHGFPAVLVPADGDYLLAVDADAGGFYSGRYALLVGLADPPASLQREAEPAGQVGQNDSLATAQALSPGLLVGQYQTPGASPNDADTYKVTITAPTRVRVALVAGQDGVARGGAPWDSVLELVDAHGVVLWRNDDTYFLDAAIDYVVTVPGPYHVRITRVDAADVGSAPYLLSYQAVPYAPTEDPGLNGEAGLASPIGYGDAVRGAFAIPGDQFYAFTGSAGDLVRLWVQDATHLQGSAIVLTPGAASDAVFLDVDGETPLAAGASYPSAPPGASELNVRQTILQADGTYYVRVRSDVAGTYGLLLERVAAAGYEAEPNDTPAQANAFGSDGWISGAIGTRGDRDHYRVHAEAGQLVSVSAYAAPGGNDAGPFGDWGSALVPTLQVLDPLGEVVSAASADRLGESNFAESVLRPDSMVEVSFRATVAGDYVVVVSDANGLGAPSFFYALQLWRNQ